MTHAGQLEIFGTREVRQPRRRVSEARTRKSNGQFLAARRAGKLWQENALVALQRFLGLLRSDKGGQIALPEFTFEEFRLYCKAAGIAEPASVNAWGALPAVACRAGLCVWSGRVRAATRPESHNRLIKVWRLAA